METPKGNKPTKRNSGTLSGKKINVTTSSAENQDEHTVVVGYASEKKSTKAPDLSDELRKVAAKYDESDYRHWVPMIIADRMGKIEELLQEYAPDSNILDSIVEFGRNTDWKSDKKEILRKAASTVGAASLNMIASAVAKKMKGKEAK